MIITKDLHKGIIMIILSAFSFATMALFVRLAGDLPAVEKGFFRNFVAVFVSLFILIRDGRGFSFKKGSLPFLTLRAVFGTVGLLCNFYAIDRLVLADANILNKLSPFFAMVASAIFLKEKIKPYQICVVIAALIGAVFIVKPSFSNASTSAALIGMCGGLGAGLAYTCVRHLGQKGERGPVIVFFFSVFSCVACLPPTLLCYEHISLFQLGMLIMAGVMAACGQFTITAAYFYAPAKEISVYDYTSVMFAAFWGFVFFGQIPDIYSFIGYIIICAAAIFNFKKNAKEHEQDTQHVPFHE